MDLLSTNRCLKYLGTFKVISQMHYYSVGRQRAYIIDRLLVRYFLRPLMRHTR